MIFAEEGFSSVISELLPLWEAHWQETEMYRHGQKLNPDLKRYQQFNDIGFYRLFTARVDGVLVGNAGMYVSPCMHTQTIIATDDTWFLKPEFRVGWNAIKFLNYVEKIVVALGAKRIDMDAKVNAKSGLIMQRRGYAHIGNRYSKEL